MMYSVEMTEEKGQETVDGGKTRREQLEIVRIHQDEWIIICRHYQPRHTQSRYEYDDNYAPTQPTILCVGTEPGRCWTYYEPVKWKTFAGAEKWVLTGYMAQIQEGYTILDCGFRTAIIQPRRGFDD